LAPEPGPFSGADRPRAELLGVHVKSTDAVPDGGGSRLEEHKELLAELGGTYREVLGNDVAKAFVQTARAENATQLVIGATHRSRIHELLRGSIVNSVIREASGVVDVHVISLPGTKGSGEGVVPRWPRLSPLPRRRQVTGWAMAAAGMPLLTLALTHARGQVGFPTALIAYLLVVMAVALAGGIWPALPGAVAGFLLSNYYFVPPIHTFTISYARDVTALVAFLVGPGGQRAGRPAGPPGGRRQEGQGGGPVPGLHGRVAAVGTRPPARAGPEVG
jgi:two-component system sensor histidine kinase KdpD